MSSDTIRPFLPLFIPAGLLILSVIPWEALTSLPPDASRHLRAGLIFLFLTAAPTCLYASRRKMV